MAPSFRLAAVSLALAGCGGHAPAKRPAAPHDPVEAAALAAPLLIDPDLTAMSRRYELLSFAEPIPAPRPAASPSARR
ncbi:MAG TPA: hypothetical protein VM055_03465 [Novosphingobium sp.]|nr:hypothetical protein [Novosphingobium sp.]